MRTAWMLDYLAKAASRAYGVIGLDIIYLCCFIYVLDNAIYRYITVHSLKLHATSSFYHEPLPMTYLQENSILNISIGNAFSNNGR